MTPLNRLGQWVAATRSTLTELIAPIACPICEAETIGTPICPDCRDELREAAGLACPRCALSVGPWASLEGGCSECRGQRLGFDAAMALGPYFGPIRELCLRLKHERDAWLARWLAEVLTEARADQLHAEIHDDPNALVVPVPLHWQRRFERGYNQAEALAESLSRALGLQFSPALRRVKRTAMLAGAGRAERASRLKGAFQCRVSRRRLEGRTVLLVDDILTTGATCSSAARALKAQGASRVVAVVIARAEGNG